MSKLTKYGKQPAGARNTVSLQTDYVDADNDNNNNNRQ